MRGNLTFCGCLLVALPLMAADLFSGTWKLQADKRGGEAWAQYDKEGDILVWSNPSGIVGKFRIDGKEYPVYKVQRTISFKQIDELTLESTQKFDGKIARVEVMTFSADGKTRTVLRKEYSDKGVSELTRTSRRAGGAVDRAIPLIGKWESDWSTATGTSPVLVIQANKDKIRLSGLHSYEATLDGNDNQVTRSPNADTVSVSRLNEGTLEQTLKAKGKLVSVTILSVSEGGKLLTMNMRRANGNVSTFEFAKE